MLVAVLLLAILGLFTACPNPKAKLVIIKFDSTVTCEKGYFGGDGVVKSGAELQAGDDLQFTAILAPDEIVTNWYINDEKQNYESKKTFSYTVEMADAKYVDDQKVIKISYEKKTAEKITIKFDSTVSCEKGWFGDGDVVNTETELKERDDVQFTAQLSSGQEVKNWLINGKETLEIDKTFLYTIDPEDAIEEGGKKVIEVSFKTK